MPDVLDQHGQAQSWDWLLANLGPLSLERAVPAKPGQPVFRLDQVRVIEGPAVLVIRVSDTQGLPLEGVLVVRSWRGAPTLPAWPALAGRWREEGVFGPTGKGGAVGFGLGASDQYALPGVGPSSVWVADQAGPSDRIDGLGVVAARRLHLDLSFRVRQEVAPVVAQAGSGSSQSQASPPAVEPPSPPSPPPAPLPLTGDQWALLIQRLDQVIQALEEQTGDG